MKPEHIGLAIVAVVLFFVAKPALDKAKAEAAKRDLDMRAEQAEVAKKESMNTAMTGFGSFMTSGGALAASSASLMTKISDMIG